MQGNYVGPVFFVLVLFLFFMCMGLNLPACGILTPLPSQVEPGNAELHLRDVTCRWKDVEVLRNITLDVTGSKLIAVVGPVGAGVFSLSFFLSLCMCVCVCVCVNMCVC